MGEKMDAKAAHFNSEPPHAMRISPDDFLAMNRGGDRVRSQP